MTSQTLHSVCDHRGCRRPIRITAGPGQKWADVDWTHTDRADAHRPLPELRFAIDATCPGCEYPEVGYSPALEQFVCSRCQWADADRPVDDDVEEATA